MHSIEALKLSGVIVLNSGEILALSDEVAQRSGVQEHRHNVGRRNLEFIEVSRSIGSLLLLFGQLVLLEIQDLISHLADLLVKLVDPIGRLLIRGSSGIDLLSQGCKLGLGLRSGSVCATRSHTQAASPHKHSRQTSNARDACKAALAGSGGCRIHMHKRSTALIVVISLT